MHDVDLTVYPDDCDAFGHLNQASFLVLFERARWEMLARGPGMDVFSRHGIWPALRKTVIDYHVPALPGDILRFQTALTHRGRSSFVLRQTARRTRGDELVATGEFVFVCIDRTGHPVPVPEEIGRSLAGATEATERFMVNGVSLAVDVQGDGPAILFIHGFPLNRSLWRDQLGGLPGWRRIAPDLRGMGQSDAPDLGYSMATYASDLAALLDVLDVERVVLCGLSMGGYVAFEFLRRWPKRVAGLVLMDTKAEADTPEGRRGREQMIATTREQGASAVAEAMLPRLLAAGTTAEEGPVLHQVRAMVESTPVAGLIGALGAMRDRPDSTPLLAALRGLPTLVMVGAEDAITPPDLVRAMAERIPGAEFEILPGAGHLPPVEQPAATTDRLRRFLEPLLQT